MKHNIASDKSRPSNAKDWMQDDVNAEGRDECGQDKAPTIPQPGEDASEVVAHG